MRSRLEFTYPRTEWKSPIWLKDKNRVWVRPIWADKALDPLMPARSLLEKW